MEDPEEHNNLASTIPNVLKEMQSETKLKWKCCRSIRLFQSGYLYCSYLDDFHIEELCKITEQASGSYISFMDLLKWNPDIRGELMEHIELRKSPFGTPAELACQTTTVVSMENYNYDIVEETEETEMWVACDMKDRQATEELEHVDSNSSKYH